MFTVFKQFKNHKNQRYISFENLQSTEYQTGTMFFHLKIAQLYYVFLSRLFSNYLKIIKIKDRRLC